MARSLERIFLIRRSSEGVVLLGLRLAPGPALALARVALALDLPGVALRGTLGLGLAWKCGLRFKASRGGCALQRCGIFFRSSESGPVVRTSA